MESVYIVMPAYNEEDVIADVVKAWYFNLEYASENSRLVVADAGSTDCTHTILKELEKKLAKLEILEDTEKGHGPKLIALYKHAINKHADFIFQTDSDGQTNPDEFAEFWNNRIKYDAILGKRVNRGDGKVRTFVEKVVCILLYLYFGIKISDANAPFRLMRASIVSKYINKFESTYNLPNIMLSAFFLYYKEKIMFKEISFSKRSGGKFD